MLNANQVCVVTGAGKGIGRGIAKVLASEGATVIAASRNEANLRATVEMITAAGGRASHCLSISPIALASASSSNR